MLVALAPFVAITIVLAGVALAFPSLRPITLGALLLHTGGTSGDWALLNFMRLHRGGEVYTYDDAETGTSYFYRRIVP